MINSFMLRAQLQLLSASTVPLTITQGIDTEFTKYLKESCWLSSDQYFHLKYFKDAFAIKISQKQ